MSREEEQEKEYARPYHHLIVDTGHGITYVSLLRIVRCIVDAEPCDSILDAGCGDGRLLAELAGSPAALFGVDTSLRALRYAAGFSPRAGLSAQNLAALGFASESVSAVTLIETLEHVPPEATDRVLAELGRVLKTDGRLVASVPTPLLPLQAKHYRHFTPDEFRSALERHFVVERLMGHHRRSFLHRALVTLGDNRFWQLRAGLNRIIRWHFRKFLEDAPPQRALRLIAVCTKRPRGEG